jgi:hypothetical protein
MTFFIQSAFERSAFAVPSTVSHSSKALGHTQIFGIAWFVAGRRRIKTLERRYQQSVSNSVRETSIILDLRGSQGEF